MEKPSNWSTKAGSFSYNQDLYASVISKDHAKIKEAKQKTEQKLADMNTDSDSDSDANTEMSIACNECASRSDHEDNERAHLLNEVESAFLNKLKNQEEITEDASDGN